MRSRRRRSGKGIIIVLWLHVPWLWSSICLLCRYEEEHFLRLSLPGRKHRRRAAHDEEELTDFSALKGLTSGEVVRLQSTLSL